MAKWEDPWSKKNNARLQIAGSKLKLKSNGWFLRQRKNNGAQTAEKKQYSTAAGTHHTATIRVNSPIGLAIWLPVPRIMQKPPQIPHRRIFRILDHQHTSWQVQSQVQAWPGDQGWPQEPQEGEGAEEPQTGEDCQVRACQLEWQECGLVCAQACQVKWLSLGHTLCSYVRSMREEWIYLLLRLSVIWVYYNAVLTFHTHPFCSNALSLSLFKRIIINTHSNQWGYLSVPWKWTQMKWKKFQSHSWSFV